MWIYNNNELCHYGILGMKWGIRRTPEQLGRHTIPKGTTVYRSTVDKDESTSGSKYVTYLLPDRDKYRGDYANGLRTQSGKSESDPLYEKSYVLKEDLVVPSREELKSVALKIANDKRNLKELGKTRVNNYFDTPEGQQKLWNRAFEKNYWKIRAQLYTKEKDGFSPKDAQALITDDLINNEKKTYGKELLDNYMKTYGSLTTEELFVDSARSLGPSSIVKKEIISELSKRGYNAMVDEAGVGGLANTVREGVDPLIIFDGNKSLSERTTSEIDKLTEKEATKQYTKFYNTANRHSRNRQW